jgi:hypothetical protein
MGVALTDRPHSDPKVQAHGGSRDTLEQALQRIRLRPSAAELFDEAERGAIARRAEWERSQSGE